MKKIIAFSVSLLVTSLVVFGAGLSASAAPINPTATSTGTVGTSGTNLTPITISATTVDATSTMIRIYLPTGWSFVAPSALCTSGAPSSDLTVTGISTFANCTADNSTGGLGLFNSSALGSGVTVTVTFAVGTLNLASARDFIVMFALGGSAKDTGTATLGASSSSTVTFDANGGSGTTAAQSASSATALTANGFTRANYTFNGWNTAADGTGTAYADGASYPFSSSTTLYAQWKAELANTGIDAAPYLSTGAVLALAGVVLMLFARRRHVH